MNDWTSESLPDLLRITCVTAAVPDLSAAEKAYCDLLRLTVAERGRVDAELALSWNASAAEGAEYVLLLPQNENDVYFRLVATAHPAGYAPLTTFGWNAFEVIVDDVKTLCERIKGSSFRLIGEPLPLAFMPSIVAMQVVGPGAECLYFTMETGDREASILPRPGGFVGRTFIVVVGGADFTAMHRWWIDHFNLRERPVRQSKVRVLQAAQDLDPDHTIELSAIGMRHHGNLLEIDGYPHGVGLPAIERTRVEGHLPPGNAIVTLEVEDAERWVDLASGNLHQFAGRLYDGRTSIALTGPAGELIELVSERRTPTVAERLKP